MQNITYRVPGWLNWFVYNPDGSVRTNMSGPATKRVLVRQQYSSGRPFPTARPLPIHDYELIAQDYQVQRSVFFKYSDGRTENCWGDYLALAAGGLDPFQPVVDWAYLESKALDELNEKTRGSLDLSVDIAEASQLRRMFNYTQKVEEYTRTFTRRFGAIKTASRMYLEYIYGVKPLVSSVFGAADELARHVINRTERFRARYSTHDLPKKSAINTRNGIETLDVVGGSAKSSVTYGVLLDQKEWDATRFSSLNPVSIAWELTPYSFVADWFLDIGGYLRNLETGLLYANRFRGGYRTRLFSAELALQRRLDGNVPNSYTFSGADTGTARAVYINRSQLSVYPVPRLPSFRADLGSSRLLSAASLLGNMLSSGGNPATFSPKLNRAVQRGARGNQPQEHVVTWQRGYEHL